MTPAERRDPSIINGSRRARIALGSGVTVADVNGLITRFNQAAKMMKRMSNKMGPVANGMAGFGGGSQAMQKKKGKKKKGKSGNPAKREAEERALRDRLSGKSAPMSFGDQDVSLDDLKNQISNGHLPDLSSLSGMLGH